jgi:hypothetical protein
MDTDRTDGDAEECTTTGSFGDHGVDGQRLIEGTYRRLAAADQRTFSDGDRFYKTVRGECLGA